MAYKAYIFSATLESNVSDETIHLSGRTRRKKCILCVFLLLRVWLWPRCARQDRQHIWAKTQHVLITKQKQIWNWHNQIDLLVKTQEAEWPAVCGGGFLLRSAEGWRNPCALTAALQDSAVMRWEQPADVGAWKVSEGFHQLPAGHHVRVAVSHGRTFVLPFFVCLFSPLKKKKYFFFPMDRL